MVIPVSTTNNFYDTGLACALLDIRSAAQVATHFLRGGLFENLVINEFIKRNYHRGIEPELTFWRDSSGNEVDLLQYAGGKPHAYEIKSGATYSPDYFKGLTRWAKLAQVPTENLALIYAGDISMVTQQGFVTAWKEM